MPRNAPAGIPFPVCINRERAQSLGFDPLQQGVLWDLFPAPRRRRTEDRDLPLTSEIQRRDAGSSDPNVIACFNPSSNMTSGGSLHNDYEAVGIVLERAVAGHEDARAAIATAYGGAVKIEGSGVALTPEQRQAQVRIKQERKGRFEAERRELTNLRTRFDRLLTAARGAMERTSSGRLSPARIEALTAHVQRLDREIRNAAAAPSGAYYSGGVTAAAR